MHCIIFLVSNHNLLYFIYHILGAIMQKTQMNRRPGQGGPPGGGGPGAPGPGPFGQGMYLS